MASPTGSRWLKSTKSRRRSTLVAAARQPLLRLGHQRLPALRARQLELRAARRHPTCSAASTPPAAKTTSQPAPPTSRRLLAAGPGAAGYGVAAGGWARLASHRLRPVGGVPSEEQDGALHWWRPRRRGYRGRGDRLPAPPAPPRPGGSARRCSSRAGASAGAS